MSTIVGLVVRVIATAILGLILGFFVAISTFADGPWEERRVLIGALLLGYGLTGLALGVRASAWYGLGLAVPGLFALLLFGVGDDGPWRYLLYGALILAFAAGGAILGATRWPGEHPRERTSA